MKGKLITDVTTSDNEMIVIGTEVEIVDIRYGCEVYYMCIIPSGRQIMINANDIEITDYSRYIDWEQRRYELAKNFAASIVSSYTVKDINNSFIINDYGYDIIADLSIKLADILIKRLKGE